MNSFDECLIKFNKKIQEFINDYKLLDDREPFTLEIINNILKIYEENYSSSANEVNVFERRKAKLDEGFKKVLNDYYKQEKKRNAELKTKKADIKTDLDEKIKASKIELADIKKQYEKNEYETLNDINFYIDSSNQNIDMFEIEYKDNINRFAYQIDVAKSSYNSNIDTFNSQLEAQLEKITAEYEKNLESSRLNYESLVESYNLIIAEKNELIENKKKEYSEEKVNLNNKKRQEYVSLNNQIRQYTEEKNDKITEYRNTYMESQNRDNLEKETNNADYKNQNFKANKDFVQNINDLDNKIRDLREDFDDYCQELNQNKFYTIYDLHVEQERLIKQFLKAENDDKKIKKELKRINKLFYNRSIEEHKKTEKIIKTTEKDFLVNIKKEMYQKKILDISRNSLFSKLNEKQTRDNKYYQEKSNGYEEEYNYKSTLATTEYNKNANKVLLDSSIRNLEIEKEIDETDAKFQIQLETLSDVIKKYQLEIQIAKRLHDLNTLYLTDKYNREVSFLTVSNILKIEKCKVLDMYNINQYELNIKNSKNILEYSENKIKIQNEKYNALRQQDILIQNKQLEGIVVKSSFDDYSTNFFSTTEEESLNKEFDHINNINKTKLLKEKYIVELDEYQNVLQSFIIIYSNIVKAWNDIVDYIFDSVTKTNDKIVIHFLSKMEREFKQALNNLNDTYKEMVSKEIASHIKFDNDFKYKASFDELNTKLNRELDFIFKKKDALIGESEKVKQKSDDLRLNIFTTQFKETTNRKEKAQNKAEIKRYIKELKQNNLIIDDLSQKINVLDKKAEEIQKKYDKKFSVIKNEQDEDNSPYVLFSKNVEKISNDIKEFINKNEKDETLSDKAQYKKTIPFLTQELHEDLFNNTSSFSVKYQENYDYSFEQINKNYDEEMNTFKRINDSSYERAKNKYDRDNQRILNDIKNLNIEKNNIEKRYNSIIKKNDLDHKKEINQILLAKKNNTNQFYTELYAVGDNLNDIERDYELFVKTHNDKYATDKQNIIDDTIRTKNGYNESLKNYINNRKAIINRLPSAIKANEKDLIANYKEKNKELELKVIQSKKQLNTQAKQEKKNLTIIELNYNNALVKIDMKDKVLRAKEKKSLNAELAKAN